MPGKVPGLIAYLLRRRTEILGDLTEEYAAGRSRLWLWRQFLSALAPRRSEVPEEARVFSSFWGDLRYAVRILARNPGFTAIAVFAIAAGIGVNAGIFTILNGAALKTLPLPGADRLAGVYQDVRGQGRNAHGSVNFFSTAEYRSYREQSHVFSGLMAYEPFLEVTLGGEGARELYGELASCNYFDVLDQPPALGRSFVAADCASAGASAVVVISDALWRGHFASDPQIVGRKISLNRQIFTVIGVARPGFSGTEVVAASLWAPFTMQTALEPPLDYYGGDFAWLVMMGRVKPGISLEQARADLSVIAARIDQANAGRTTRLTVSTPTLLGRPEERRFVKTVGSLIMAAVGMVLLIACANVANLLLARASGRRQEIAIRLSVGATRWRLVRQLLTESLLIAIIGGTLGSLIAFSTFQAIARFILSHLPRGAPELTFDVAPDWRVLVYSFGLTLITGVVFGLVPALRVSRPDLSSALKSGGGFLRHALVGAQVAVCTMLLVAAGLLLRGLWVAQKIDPGFDMKQAATISLNLRGQGYSPERAIAFQQQLKQRLEALPSVAAAAQARVTPLEDSHTGTGFVLQGESQPRSVEINRISPEFFSLLGIPIVRGRNFTEAEIRAGVAVAIVTESTGRRFWPGRDPLGKTLRDPDHRREFEVIGIAKDVQVSKIGYSDTVYAYLPVSPDWQRQMQWLIRYSGGYAPTAAAIRAAVSSLDSNLLISVAPLEDNLELWRLFSRIVSALAGSLGILALLLASIGIYGVVAFMVSRRVREIGIRMALGADAGAILNMILRQAIRPIAIGAAIGVVGCAAISKLLSSMLFGVSAYDPVAFVGVPLLLAGVAFIASYVPARRAMTIDPADALRSE